MGMTLREAHSALLISGPAIGAPGDELTLSVFLDTPLTDPRFSSDPTRCQKLLNTFKTSM
jgi:hypothetical protein